MTIEPSEATGDDGSVHYRVLSVRAMWLAAATIVLVGIGVAVWLLVAYGGGGDQQRNQLEAIKTAGTVVIGTGGAAALLLAARRQRSNEIALKQKDRDQADVARAFALQERVAAATEVDAAERRVTELYTKAVEQLGSDKAPVRLGGLYALERVAQNNPAQRQTIVNVLCAYLRMPYQLHGEAPDDDADEQTVQAYDLRVQEGEVRRAAQRILTEHLRPGTPAMFWQDIALNLTGAVLLDFNLNRCSVHTAACRSAVFAGDAQFESVIFTGDADFASATFTGRAYFTAATFADGALFQTVIFIRGATFRRAAFARAARFRSAAFAGGADFGSANFAGGAHFGSAGFTGEADFTSATFAGDAHFESVRFAGEPYGSGTQPWTDFGKASFARRVPQEVARFASPPSQETPLPAD